MDPTMAYIGVRECGCVVAAVVDAADYKKEIARTLAEYILRGLAVERVSLDQARERLRTGRCDCPAKDVAFERVS